jgi:ferredoxin-NADP reductase
MKKGAFEDFDGYREIAEAIDYSRRYGVDYTAERDSADAYIRRLHPASLRLRVAEIIAETPQARTFRLVADHGRLPPFQAGQYVAVACEVGGVRTSRPYSISSPPSQTGYYDLTVQRVQGGFVSDYLLDKLRRGDVLETSGPAGEFFHNPLFHSTTQVMIAGGSGVTPFMSMIREVLDCGLERTIYLFFGNRNLAGAIRHQEFSRLADQFENFHYIPVIEKPGKGFAGRRGFLTGELVKEVVGDLADKTFYVCGPQAMYDFCLPQLEALGIPRKRLRREMYGLPARIWEDPGWPRAVGGDAVFNVKVNGGRSFEARAGEPLLAALERNRVVVPSLCRCGECSMCRVRLVSGRVFQPAGAKVRKSDRQFGYIHSCAAFPLADVEIAI